VRARCGSRRFRDRFVWVFSKYVNGQWTDPKATLNGKPCREIPYDNEEPSDEEVRRLTFPQYEPMPPAMEPSAPVPYVK
jgi:hypothetical protein